MNINTDIVRQADPLGGTALIAAASSLAPDALRGRPQDALIVLMAGRELGLAPMQSMRMLSVIKGKVTLAADATVALVRRSGECVEWRLVETTAQRATYMTRRKGDTEPTTLTWTIEQAQRAGLTGGQGWRSYPEAMLRARCASALARVVYPDLVAGIYDPDELATPIESAPRQEPAPVPNVRVEASVPVGMSQDVAVVVGDDGERRSIIGELLCIGDDVPDFVESQLSRSGHDLATAPTARLRSAADFMVTARGRAAIQSWRDEREAALDAGVVYTTEHGEG
jgi:hypothetical protein